MTTTVAATFCATMVDEWARAGVRLACVSPGSRSTPMALALAADPRIEVAVFTDERSAGFAALGSALATGTPAVALCTSGTAATHFHAAVVEADLSSVPLIVCTADRPPELWDIGAPQTIDQTRLYGPSVRFFAQPGVPDAAMAATWRPLASRLVAEAAGWQGRPGPVQVNVSFRDPLVGEPGDLPPGRPDGAPWHTVVPARAATLDPAAASLLVDRVTADGRARPGVIIAGAGAPPAAVVHALAQRLGWPVLADHRSRCQGGPAAVAHFDALLRSDRFTAEARPDVVLRLGETLASKVLSQWLAGTGADVVAVVDGSRWIDPEQVASTVVAAPGAVEALLCALDPDLTPADQLACWVDADRRAATAIASALATAGGSALDEVSIARAVAADVPAGGALVVSSSMPIRDLEWFGPRRDDIDVFANRGANGIDGVIATAIGIALTGRPTTLLIGDVAFLHDASSLTALRDRPVTLDIVVIDNDGGGIFSFLPQAGQVGADRFELLFGTPHGTDLAALARAHGLTTVPWPPPPRPASAGAAAAAGADIDVGGVRVCVARTVTDRGDGGADGAGGADARRSNVSLHAALTASVLDALSH